MSAYLLVIRDRDSKPVSMGIYSAEALTLGVHHRAERAPRDYAETDGKFSDARKVILGRMLMDREPWPAELQPFIDEMLAEVLGRPASPSYREPAPDPAEVSMDHLALARLWVAWRTGVPLRLITGTETQKLLAWVRSEMAEDVARNTCRGCDGVGELAFARCQECGSTGLRHGYDHRSLVRKIGESMRIDEDDAWALCKAAGLGIALAGGPIERATVPV